MIELSDHLKGILDTLPLKPGCYIMKNDAGNVIYVGKAINLRNRVRSYFQDRADMDRKTSRLVKQIVDLEWIVVGSELEALILEMNLIKKHRPQFNVRLKDDKRYPYIKVHLAAAFPKVTVTRQMVSDGSRYFGPLYQRVGGAPDPRPAAAYLPLPDLRPRDHRYGRPSVSLL